MHADTVWPPAVACLASLTSPVEGYGLFGLNWDGTRSTMDYSIIILQPRQAWRCTYVFRMQTRTCVRGTSLTTRSRNDGVVQVYVRRMLQVKPAMRHVVASMLTSVL